MTINNKPILFSGPMIRAIMREIENPGTGKTQTRRVIEKWREPVDTHKFEDADKRFSDSRFMSVAQKHRRWGFGVFGATEKECMENYNNGYNSCNPYGQPGDLLWVRENMKADRDTSNIITLGKYSADGAPVLYPGPEIDENGEDDYGGKMAHWEYSRDACPSIHMPKMFSRLTLEITDIRVEPLQDISEEDALAEGINKLNPGRFEPYEGAENIGEAWPSAKKAFHSLWDSINSGRGFGWRENPWVWAVTFKPHLINVDDFIARAKESEAA